MLLNNVIALDYKTFSNLAFFGSLIVQKLSKTFISYDRLRTSKLITLLRIVALNCCCLSDVPFTIIYSTIKCKKYVLLVSLSPFVCVCVSVHCTCTCIINFSLVLIFKVLYMTVCRQSNRPANTLIQRHWLQIIQFSSDWLNVIIIFKVKNWLNFQATLNLLRAYFKYSA